MMQDKWQSWIPKANPYEPAEWDEDVVFAIRALAAGNANEVQQKLAIKWIEYVTGTKDFEDLSFRPGNDDGERNTTFAEGKRFVGLQIWKMLHPATLAAVERAREARAQNQARGKK